MPKPHMHRAAKGQETARGWTHCVNPAECAADPAKQRAHGNIICVDTCSCGATRESEMNGGRVNYGPWREETETNGK